MSTWILVSYPSQCKPPRSLTRHSSLTITHTMHSTTEAHAFWLPLKCYAPYADLLEADVCGEMGARQTSVFTSNQKCDSAICVEILRCTCFPLPLTTCMHEYNAMQPDKWFIFDQRPRSATYPVSHNGKALIYLRLALIMNAR